MPGVEFKLRNNGTRSLSRVNVTVYFQDRDGRNIGEASYYPDLVNSFGAGTNKPLKPNYVWQIEDGGFYAAKKVPSEWLNGSARFEITEIGFE